MKMTIKGITLENFMGVKNATHNNFSDNVVISGQNGSGKTTIATAHNWLWFDKDYALHSNPPIRMIGAEECTVSVTEDIEIDGKPIQVCKMQNMTVKGARIALSNTYTINGVPKTESAFLEYFTELGVDFNLMSTLSCPDIFVSEKAADKRSILFDMASSITDKSIAMVCDDCMEVCQMLDTYKLEEIEALQKQTLRKIKEVYGDKGEILMAQITGLESARQTKDISYIVERIEQIKDRIDTLNDKRNQITIIDTSDFDKKVQETKSAIMKKSDALMDRQFALKSKKKELDAKTKLVKELQTEWKSITQMKFDEKKLNCPTCGRPYEESSQEKIKGEFEYNKKKALNDVISKGKTASDEKAKLTEEVANLENEIETITSEKASSEHYLGEIIKENESVVEANKRAKISIESILEEISALENQIHTLEIEKAKADNNAHIDNQIMELRQAQETYEQNRADAERILEQLKTISMKKNEMLVADINKHFEIVDFILFVTQKNGDVKSTCVVTLDGYRYGESTNTGREMLAKLDIIRGLQTFHNQFYPVFLDSAESLSNVTVERIDMPYQLFTLKVTEDKELTIA